MSILLVVYVTVLFLLGYIFLLITKNKIRHSYEKYLVAGIVFLFLWILLYMLLFFFKLDSHIDIYRVKVLYGLWFLILYSMLAFFYFYGMYDARQKKHYKYFHVWFIVFLTTVFTIIMGTDKIISGIEYNSINGESYETLGSWYILLEILHLLSLVLLIGIIIYKRRTLQGIYKIRYNYIAFGYFVTMLFQIIFLSILPAMDIWVMQREQIMFFIPFLWWLFYSMHRYRFRKISFGVWRIVVFLFSAVLSVVIILTLKKLLILMDPGFLIFWSINHTISWWDIIIWNIAFYATHRYLQHQFKLYYDSSFVLQQQLTWMKNKIPFLQTNVKLDNFLQTEFLRKTNIKNTGIIVGDDLENITELVQYFRHDGVNNFFLNDVVFIEENKNKFSKKEILSQLNPDMMLYIPMYKQKGEILGLLSIWKKPFNDYYRSTEIELLQEFASFLTWHLTYINIFAKIYDLNLTLDKKVDEKTIEYNNLINRLKEFIAYVGHEIRNPITNTIFLCYDLQEKINEAIDKKLLPREFKEDIDVLSGELQKVSDLSKKIFTTEKLELGKTKLYKNRVLLNEFLMSEISVLETNNSHVVFEKHIQDVWSVDIDEVQFRQVIQNLMGNALKFIPKRKWKIRIILAKTGNNIYVAIEDNGKGFADIDSANVFDKYQTWNHESSGLGMGLYLCKKIVELHGGTIKSSISDKLTGAKFTIIL